MVRRGGRQAGASGKLVTCPEAHVPGRGKFQAGATMEAFGRESFGSMVTLVKGQESWGRDTQG